MDKEMTSDDVKAKREAAHAVGEPRQRRRAASPSAWRYLLVSESDVDTARGSWAALKKLGADD